MASIVTVMYSIYQLVSRPHITFNPWENVDTIRKSSNVLSFVVMEKIFTNSHIEYDYMLLSPSLSFSSCEDTILRKRNFFTKAIINLEAIKSNIVGISP